MIRLKNNLLAEILIYYIGFWIVAGLFSLIESPVSGKMDISYKPEDANLIRNKIAYFDLPDGYGLNGSGSSSDGSFVVISPNNNASGIVITLARFHKINASDLNLNDIVALYRNDNTFSPYTELDTSIIINGSPYTFQKTIGYKNKSEAPSIEMFGLIEDYAEPLLIYILMPNTEHDGSILTDFFNSLEFNGR